MGVAATPFSISVNGEKMVRKWRYIWGFCGNIMEYIYIYNGNIDELSNPPISILNTPYIVAGSQ